MLYILLDFQYSSEIVVRPGMNRCNISEEETTKALYALYQMPISEGQNNMQSHAAGPETGVGSVDALQLGLNRKKSSSDVMLDRGKKKHGINEKARSVINNDIGPADSNRMKKSISKHSSRLNNLIEEKNTPKVKEKQMNGGISFTSGLIYYVVASY